MVSKLNILLFVLVFAGVTLRAQHQLSDTTPAIIGGHVITEREIESKYQEMTGQQKPESMRPAERCKVLDNLLTTHLMLAIAKRDKMTVTPSESKAEFDRRVNYFVNIFGSRAKLEEYYGKSISQMKTDFKEAIETELLSDKMKTRIFSTVKVSPEEVKSFFNKIPADSIPFYEEQFEPGEIILFPKPGEEQKKLAKQRLENVSKEIVEKGDSAIIETGETVTEFETSAKRLKPGELSKVIEADNGYYRILLDEKRGQQRKIHFIRSTPQITASDAELLREKAGRIRNQLATDTLTWLKAVKLYSEDTSTKNHQGLMINPATGNSFFVKSQLEKSAAEAIEGLRPGDFSKVLPFHNNSGQNQGCRILWLKSRIPAHKANLKQDYQQIEKMALEEKREKALDAWIKRNKKLILIEINNAAKGCPPLSKWLQD